LASRLSWRETLVLIAALGVAPAVFVVGQWKQNAEHQIQQYPEPFRIADNFYFVGDTDVATFLIAGPQGHVLLDGGRTTMTPMMMKSIAKLGFDIKDVKVLLNSTPDLEQAGGFAALQQASGANLWASEASAPVIASGGKDPDFALPARALFGIGVLAYPPAHVDHRFKDGDTIRIGPIAVTAHVTGGSTRGATTWTFSVRDGDRMLNVVSANGVWLSQGTRYAEQRADIERTLRLLRSLPVDIWVTSHNRYWARYPKFTASRTAKNPVDPFIDREGYRVFIDTAEADFRNGVTH